MKPSTVEINEAWWYNARTMVSKLERLAREYRENGFLAEAAMLEADAVDFRIAGVPDQFPIKFVKIEEARSKIAVILSNIDVAGGKPLLNADVAKEINENVGQYLEDEVRISDLYLGRMNKASLLSIDRNVKRSYTECLNAFKRNEYRTLGQIRQGLYINKHPRGRIGPIFLNFARNAFASPQQPQS